MDENKENSVDNILNILKPSATSTAVKKNVPPQFLFDDDIDSSLGVLSLSSASSLLTGLKCGDEENDVSQLLLKERSLAEQSLNRLPSRYLKPRNSVSNTSIASFLSGSTISESDLLSPKNNSTPRESLASNYPEPKLSIGHAMAELSKKLSNNDISIDNLIKQYKSKSSVPDEPNSEMFQPADLAQSQLMADELSWRRKNDLPIRDESFAPVEPNNLEKISITDFFRQRSNNLSDLHALSPKRAKPVPLIQLGNPPQLDYPDIPQNNGNIPDTKSETRNNISPKKFNVNKTVSISQIGKLLSQTDAYDKLMQLCNGEQQKQISSDESELAIPISKNSSYTSNYSENEIIKGIGNERMETFNKANTTKANMTRPVTSSSMHNHSQSHPSRASSTLSHLENGKLPLESSKCELTWGCLKVGRCLTKNFLIRNKSSKTIRIQLTITGLNFKLRKDNHNDSDPLTTTKILLHGNESRQYFISFIPTMIGAASEELRFQSIDFPDQHVGKQAIKLNGYGGYINIDLDTLPKEVSGKYCLNFGIMNSNILSKKIIVRNTGNIPAFIYFEYTRKHLTTFSNVTVVPNFCSIIPNEMKEVVFTFEPTANDQKSMHITKNLVIEIGSFKMIYGAEANRGRLRRLVKKSKEAGVAVEPLYEQLSCKIPGEVIPSDAFKIRDSVPALSNIVDFFNYNDIVATIEHDPEQTLMPQLHDESDFFTSLCAENTVIENSVHQKDCCKMEPNLIILTPPTKSEDSIFLISETERILHFEALSNPPGLEISPKEGKLTPKEIKVLKVKYAKCLSQKQSYKIIVYVDNAILEAEVKVFYIDVKTAS